MRAVQGREIAAPLGAGSGVQICTPEVPGAKARPQMGFGSARLKACPDTKVVLG